MGSLYVMHGLPHNSQPNLLLALYNFSRDYKVGFFTYERSRSCNTIIHILTFGREVQVYMSKLANLSRHAAGKVKTCQHPSQLSSAAIRLSNSKMYIDHKSIKIKSCRYYSSYSYYHSVFKLSPTDYFMFS